MTYVLVHGGGATARFWDRLLPHLDRPALAVDLPGRNGKPADLATLTVEDEVASVLADVAAAGVGTPIILVAHSSGGLVVPGVVAGLADRVAHVILNAALVPPGGGCGLDCMKPRHRDAYRAPRGSSRRLRCRSAHTPAARAPWPPASLARRRKRDDRVESDLLPTPAPSRSRPATPVSILLTLDGRRGYEIDAGKARWSQRTRR